MHFQPAPLSDFPAVILHAGGVSDRREHDGGGGVMTAVSGRHPHVLAQPVRDRSLVDRSVGQCEPRRHAGRVVSGQLKTVQVEKDLCREEANALVSVEEGMVFRQPECVGSSQRRKVGFAIRKQVLRTIEGAIEESVVTDTRRPAMLDPLLFVQVKHGAPRHPSRDVQELFREGAEHRPALPQNAPSGCHGVLVVGVGGDKPRGPLVHRDRRLVVGGNGLLLPLGLGRHDRSPYRRESTPSRVGLKGGLARNPEPSPPDRPG